MDKSLGLSNGKKVAKRNGSLPTLRQPVMPSTIYSSSSPVVSSTSPSTEVGSAISGAGIRLPGRPRGGKLDRSKAAKMAGGQVAVKEEPSSPTPGDSANLTQQSSSSSSSGATSSSGSSSSNESSNDEEQPVPVHRNISKVNPVSEQSPATSVHEVKPFILGASSPTAMSPTSSSAKVPSSSAKPSPSSKVTTAKPASSTIPQRQESPAKPANSKPQFPVSKPSNTSPTKTAISEVNSPALEPASTAVRQPSKQQQATVTKELSSSTKSPAKQLVVAEHSPASQLTIALVKMQSPSKPTSPASKPQSSPVKPPTPEVQLPADFRQLNDSLLGVRQTASLSSSSSEPSQTSTPSRPTISNLICSETLPSVMPRKTQQPRVLDSPNGSIADSAQSLLSLAMASPITAQNSPDFRMSQMPQSNHISASHSHSKTSPLLSPSSDVSIQEGSHKRLRDGSDRVDSDGKEEDEEDEEEEVDDRDEEEDEMISETNDDDEETEDDDKDSLIPLTSGSSSNSKGTALLAPAKSQLDGRALSSVESRPVSKEQSTDLSLVKNSSSTLKQLSVSSSSCSPDSKRKWREFETSEEYEGRKRARHADMDYLVNFSKFYLFIRNCLGH